ncbi:hypothetical protein [Winogradskyella sp.]|uniref:hypothetical protein n=1 Tax=Winogradskyella sp. TaxID=1883156 RepID=UPI002607EA5D|nr:hypothetical protein [Winogradskyella sp.]
MIKTLNIQYIIDHFTNYATNGNALQKISVEDMGLGNYKFINYLKVDISLLILFLFSINNFSAFDMTFLI